MGGDGGAGSMAPMRRSRRQAYAPVPPHEMLPARTVIVPGRGEFFVRDSGETDPARPTVMLLHGWMVTADLNWHGAYDALVAAGYRVLAVDHRGHGRGAARADPVPAGGLRRRRRRGPARARRGPGGRRRLLDGRRHRPADGPRPRRGDERARAQRHLPALPGPRDPQAVEVDGRSSGCSWAWRRARSTGWAFAAPRSASLSAPPGGSSELMRHEARDVAAAGRELGRFDSRPWLASLTRPATAMVLTTRDQMVAPAKQRELAQASGAQRVRGGHRPPRGRRPLRRLQPRAHLGGGGGGGAAERPRRLTA